MRSSNVTSARRESPATIVRCRGGGRFLLAVALLISTMLPGMAFGGAERESRIEGVVRDSQGKPVAGASVLLLGASPSSPVRTQTSADGTFVFFPVSAGMYSVRVAKSGFHDAAEDSINLAPTQTKHCEFVLRTLSDVPLSPTGTATSPSGIELDDRPNFTVAGITDSTGSGGHGSETRLRTGEGLARETVNLGSGKSSEAGTTMAGAAAATAGREEEAKLHRMLGDLDEALGDPLGAVKEDELAVELDGSEENYFSWGAELLLHRAALPAIEVFSKGVRAHPGSARMFAGLGAALYTSGSADEAVQRLCEASDLEPTNPAPYLFLGKVQEASSTPLACAEQKLERFLHEQPDNAQANYYYALALWKRIRGTEDSGTLRRAETLLMKASALDPKLDVAYLQLGNLHFARGEFEEAVAAYQKAIAANSTEAEAHYRLGLAYKKIGDQTKAQREFDEYKRLDKTETAAVEQQRRELRQFVFVLKDQPAPPPPASVQPLSK